MMNVEIIEQLEHAFEGLDIMEQDVQLIFAILDDSDDKIYHDVKDIAGKFGFKTQCCRADNVHRMKRFRKLKPINYTRNKKDLRDRLHKEFIKKLNGV